ncbi:lysylphosphatidylglycerol synthase transmembrane domain-containing protein [Pontibacter cellulosilyticus]|uniref:Flippase-like domain-containing protein n=1 Tax=Pontibacter cellulosilyticus TaxID=1720253 RepID=A0A923N347_9BACT|nr:lysylphosphatidylglycerol synthase transmembrane domain-containing protein [Pontibacter cellulosilyticus]MBC5991368.1 flippase-like domain-containing protein [Pontibacter cellulosilyticus]
MAITQQYLKKHFSASRIILPVLLGLGVVGYMLYKNYEPGQLDILLNASLFWISMTLLVLVVRDFGYMYRIRFLTDKALNWKQSFNVIMIWEFASCALPSVVGGSTIAAYILFKEKISLGKSIAQVMVTAMLDNLYFVITLPLILLFAGSQVFPEMVGLNQTLRESIGIAFFVSYLMIALYASTMFYALFVNPKGVKKLLIRIGQVKIFRRWRTSLYQHANELLIASKHLRTKDTAFWLHASISTIFVWTARYVIIGCLIAAFTQLSFQDHLVVFSRNLVYKVVLFLSVTPGGAGVAEISFPAFFGAFLGGFTTIVVLLYRVLTYYVYLIIGAIVFPKWAAQKFGREEAEPETLNLKKPITA